jgi:hypothetical protein
MNQKEQAKKIGGESEGITTVPVADVREQGQPEAS